MAVHSRDHIDKTGVNLTPLAPAIGAEVAGLDLARPLGSGVAAALCDAFVRHGVLFFRDQSLSPGDLVAFARHFGPVGRYPFAEPLPGHPDVIAIIKEADQKTNFGGLWHTDTPYRACPSLGSVLYAVEVPAVGGDTLFASGIAAYESLSDGLKRTLAGLRVINSAALHQGRLGRNLSRDGAMKGRNIEAVETEQAIHPAVRTHPVSGRRSLYVSPAHAARFDGWSEAESRPLLDYLFTVITREENTCRFRWTKGALAVWDNRQAFHYPLNDYHGHRREMHRVTIEGDVPV